MALRAGLSIVLVIAAVPVAVMRAQGRGLPETPCDVMTPAQMSAASGLEVTSATRVETIAEIVQARRRERAPSAGTICRYDTSGPFGSIALEIPAARRAEAYTSARAAAFATYPGSTAAIPDVGADAWLAGGASLHVLVRDADYFTVATQHARPESRDVLVRIARRIVAELASSAAGDN
jgi:hypothetical protein